MDWPTAIIIVALIFAAIMLVGIVLVVWFLRKVVSNAKESEEQFKKRRSGLRF